MTRRLPLSLFVIAIAFGAVAIAAAAQDNAPPIRLRGTVASIEWPRLVLDTREGKSVPVTVGEGARLSAVEAADISAIKPGTFIGTAAVPGRDGELEALEVVVFPESLRGTGEGHYDWDLQPGSSMTNATVVATVSAANGRELDLSYKGGTAKVRVPPEAPIVTLASAERAEVKPGVAVFAVAKREADGSLSVLRMVIGRNGVKPPM